MEALSLEGDCFIEVDGHKQMVSKRSPIILNPWSLYHYSGEGTLCTRYLVFDGDDLQLSLKKNCEYLEP